MSQSLRQRMPTLRFEIENVDQLRKALRKASENLEELKEANREAARIVTTEATGRAPRRTGTLAASGRPTGGAKRATITFGSARVPYARPIHWGWPARNIRPQPFAADALEATRPEWFREYEQNIRLILHREELDA